jgi:cell filamentation protein
MYDAIADPYCYPGTTVLKNLPAILNQARLDAFEGAMTAQRADEALPLGRLSMTHYCAVHRHLFQDIYSWAGKFRSVRIFKHGSAFCYPENVPQEMCRLFADLKRRRHLNGQSAERFAAAATNFLSTLNAIHPFQEGNGRTQTTFLALLAASAGHPLSLERLEPEDFLAAMIESFKGNEQPLRQQIANLIA